MSGLCGWFGAAPEVLGIQSMAAALSRFDGARLCFASSNAGTVAAPRAWRDDRVLVATQGQDADAMAAAWRTHGVSMLASVAGSFALALHDTDTQEILLAVDRAGVEPLFFRQLGAKLVFASSCDALLRHPGMPRELDVQSIYNYLYFHVVPGPRSVYQGVQRLLPGEFLHVRRGRMERGSYWRMEFEERNARPVAELKEAFLQTLRAAVQSSLGQHKTGAFLSGGTDSSTICAMLGQVTGRPARSFSIGFDVPGYDEMAYARIVARSYQTEHHERYLSPADVADAIPSLAACFDQPFGNSSAVPAYFCARMAQSHGITRILGGDGGDELFGGNERYARQAIFSRYESIPSFWRQTLIEPMLFRALGKIKGGMVHKARRYVEQAMVPMPARLETYNLLHHYGPQALLAPHFLATIDTKAPQAAMTQVYWNCRGHSQINRMLSLDMRFTLADNDLPKVKKACELAGVGVGFPLLDDALIAFAASLPPDQKLRGTRLRHFFKESLREVLPREVLLKQKHGFGMPFGHWLQTDARLRGLAYDSLHDLKARHIVRTSFIDELLSRRVAEQAAYHGTMVWVLMMLEQWFAQRQSAWCAPIPSQEQSNEPAASPH